MSDGYSSTAGPLTSSVYTVRPEWIDRNGHMNMAYYNVLFDTSGDEILDRIGLGERYSADTGLAIFVQSSHITYLAELLAGELVRTSFHLIGCNERRLHYVKQIWRMRDNEVAALNEILAVNVDLSTRKPSDFPASVREQLYRVASAQADLALPPQVGRRIEIRGNTGPGNAIPAAREA